MENESSFIFNLLIYYCIFRCLFKFKQRDTFFFFLIRNHEAVGKYGKPWIWADLMDLGVTSVIVSWSDPHIGLPPSSWPISVAAITKSVTTKQPTVT